MPLELEYLQDILEYDSITGIFINKVNRSPKAKKGDVSGTFNKKSGYIHIQIAGKIYMAHRLAWFYVYKEWPDKIDHKDGIKNNNAILNLRSCSQLQNIYNRNMPVGKTGYRGVSNDRGRFQAKIKINGININLGRYSSAEEASKAYELKAKEVQGEFYKDPGYTYGS